MFLLLLSEIRYFSVVHVKQYRGYGMLKNLDMRIMHYSWIWLHLFLLLKFLFQPGNLFHHALPQLFFGKFNRLRNLRLGMGICHGWAALRFRLRNLRQGINICFCFDFNLSFWLLILCFFIFLFGSFLTILVYSVGILRHATTKICILLTRLVSISILRTCARVCVSVFIRVGRNRTLTFWTLSA